MNGKRALLAAALLLEGIGLVFFAQAGGLMAAIVSMLCFALFLKMANGATYSIVPFINEKNAGLVGGIVGAGGNLGGMFFGFLFKSEAISYVDAFRYIGFIVMTVSLVVFVTRYQKRKQQVEVMEESTVAAA